MPKMTWIVAIFGAIAPIGSMVIVQEAIAQTTPISQPPLIAEALEQLPEYRDPSFYEGPDSSTLNNNASVLAPELPPVPVTDAIQNLVDHYDVPLPQDNGAFEADAPMLRRDYITYMVTAFDTLNTQFSAQFAQRREDIEHECFILEMTLGDLTGRVDRLQEDMERVTAIGNPSSRSTQVIANAPLSFLKNTEEAAPEDAPATPVETNPDYYAYWFYTLEPQLIGTILSNHHQPLTQGDVASYLSPTLDGLNAILTFYIDHQLQNYREDIDWAEFQLNAIFDRVARIRGHLETLATVEHLSLYMPQPQNKVVQASADKLADTWVQTLNSNLGSRAILLPEWRNAMVQELSAQVYPIEHFPDVPSSDPFYDSLWRAINAHGITFSPPNHYVNPHVIQNVGNIYPDEALTIGDFAYYQRQWVARTLELIQYSAPIDYFPLACGHQFATTFDQETATMENTLLAMETELQQLFDNR